MKTTTNVIKTIFKASDQSTAILKKIQFSTANMVSRASKSMTRFADGTNKIAKSVGVGLTAAFAVASGAALIVGRAIMGTAASLDDMNETTTALSFPIEEFQKWTYVADRAGVSSEEFTGSLTRFSKAWSSAKFGKGNLITTLQAMGQGALVKSLKNTTNAADAFDIYVTAMRAAKTPAQQTAMAFAAFGKNSLRMANIAKMSAEEIAKLKAEMVGNGIVTQQQANEAELFNDTMDALKRTIKGFMVQVLLPLMPILTEVAADFRAWVIANRELIKIKIKEGLQWLIDNADRIKTWVVNIGKITLAFYAFVAVVNILKYAMIVLNAIVSANPWVWLALAFIAAQAAIWLFRDEVDLFMAFIFDRCAEIGNAFISAFIDIVAPFMEVFNELKNNVVSFINSVVAIWDGGWSGLVDRFYALLAGVASFFSAIGNLFVNIWSGNWDAVYLAFSSVWDRIKIKAGDVLDGLIKKTQVLGKIVGFLVNPAGTIAAAAGAKVGEVIVGNKDVVPNVADLYETPKEKTLTERLAELPGMSNLFGTQGTTPTALTDALTQYQGALMPSAAPKEASIAAPAKNERQIPRERVHVVGPEDTTYYMRETVDRSEVTIKDETKRAKVTRGRLPSSTRLFHSGGM